MKLAVHAILHALDKLHSLGLVHQDLRLENVLWRPQGKPFLTDLELAAKNDQKVKKLALYFTQAVSCIPHMPMFQVPDNIQFSEWDHGTLETRRYTFGSDLYQVGRIMAKFSQLSDEGVAFRDQLLSKKLGTATEALKHGWIGCLGECERQ